MIFWTKFSQKVYLRSKAKKVKNTLEFCIFELVYVLSFSLNWKFCFFDQICHKRVFLSKNRKFLPFFRKCTIAWSKIRKLWVNPKKCVQRKMAIPRRFTRVKVLNSCLSEMFITSKKIQIHDPVSFRNCSFQFGPRFILYFLFKFFLFIHFFKS